MDGDVITEMGLLSKPTTLISSGTSSPDCVTALSAAAARMSETAKIAFGSILQSSIFLTDVYAISKSTLGSCMHQSGLTDRS